MESISKRNSSIFIRAIIALLVITVNIACSGLPEESAITDSIVGHFNARNYDVIDIRIEEIRPFPLAKREYMAPQKYDVDISLIVLQEVSKAGDGNKKRLSFTNAKITVSRTERHNEWSIDNISGIPVI